MKYIGVTGSREFNNKDLLFQTLDGLLKVHQFITIVSGGAKGADSLAKEYATSHNLNIIEYLPEYEKHGKIAPFIRNGHIAEKCDILVACFRRDLPCNGTRDTVHKASDKPVVFIMS